MLGNRVGWVLSAIILLLWGGGLGLFHRIGTEAAAPGPLGERAAEFKLAWELDPATLAQSWMIDDADAAPLYKQAIDEYEQNVHVYNSFNGKLDTPEFQIVDKGVTLLTRAGRARQGVVFADRPQVLITYDLTRPPLKRSIRGLRQVAMKVGRQYQQSGQSDKALPIYQGIYSLGVRLCAERLVLDEWDEGREALTVAVYLAELDPARREQFQKANAQFARIHENFLDPLRNLIFIANPDPQRFPQFRSWTGDMIALATRAGDPMWRTEATLALGRARLQGYTSGDQKGARRVLTQLLGSSDERIRVAARAALDLTPVQLQRMTATTP